MPLSHVWVVSLAFFCIPSCTAVDQSRDDYSWGKDHDWNPWGPVESPNPWRNNPWNSAPPLQRAEAVKDAFEFAWKGYYNYAFPHDELHPVNNSWGNSRNGWGASALDALSTAAVMGLPDVVNQIVAYVPHINYAVSYQNQPVSVFETTIRYLAGMLSGYDLLSGPLRYLMNSTNIKNIDALLTQSIGLADLLAFAFDTPSGVPSNNIFFNNRTTDGAITNGLATIGTLVLEWTHLADLTHNLTYAQLSQKGESYLLSPTPAADEPWPGLVGSAVALNNGSFVNADGGWQGGDDSFYEYLIKMYVYDPKRFATYRDRWILAADSSMAHLLSRPSSRSDLTFLAEYSSMRLINQSEHLACFDGGNFLLGGSVLKRQDYIDFGLKLTAACHNTYISTATRIGPEVFSWNTSAMPLNQTTFYNQNGFWILDPSYILRPEVIESYYYAYRVTGNSMYQDWAWDAFMAINASTRVGSGFSDISNVNLPGGGEKLNNQDSFLFAEVMKYSYLIQAESAPWDVNYGGENQWVFNTEAHPFKVAGQAI